MQYRRSLLCVMIAAFLCGGPVHAAAVLYTWAPLVGSGIFQGAGPITPYATSSGQLDITYDPANPAATSALASITSPFLDTFGSDHLSFTLTTETFTLYGSGMASTIWVELQGTPGLLTPGGFPETLEGFLGHDAMLQGGAGGHGTLGFTFTGVAHELAPEPSAALLLAMGFGGLLLALRPPPPRGATGRGARTIGPGAKKRPGHRGRGVRVDTTVAVGLSLPPRGLPD